MFRRRLVHDAIDIDANLLNVARHSLAENHVTNCDFVAGNAYELTRLWPSPVDFVFLANAFHGVPDRERLASSVHDALAPRGLFAVVNWHQRPREETTILGEPRGPRTDLIMTPAQTARGVQAGGFKLVRVVEELLVSITSAGQIVPAGQTPYFVIIDRALRDEGTSYHYAAPAEFSHADPGLVARAAEAFKRCGLSVVAGPSWTTGAPFRETAEAIEAARSKRILAVEMEAAAL